MPIKRRSSDKNPFADKTPSLCQRNYFTFKYYSHIFCLRCMKSLSISQRSAKAKELKIIVFCQGYIIIIKQCICTLSTQWRTFSKWKITSKKDFYHWDIKETIYITGYCFSFVFWFTHCSTRSSTQTRFRFQIKYALQLQ